MKRFILLDGRAKLTGDDDAAVLDTAVSEGQAYRLGSTVWKGHDAIWQESSDESLRVILRWDIPPSRPKLSKRQLAKVKA